MKSTGEKGESSGVSRAGGEGLPTPPGASLHPGDALHGAGPGTAASCQGLDKVGEITLSLSAEWALKGNYGGITSRLKHVI